MGGVGPNKVMAVKTLGLASPASVRNGEGIRHIGRRLWLVEQGMTVVAIVYNRASVGPRVWQRKSDVRLCQ